MNGPVRIRLSSYPFVVSLSNHERIGAHQVQYLPSPFDRLIANGYLVRQGADAEHTWPS